METKYVSVKQLEGILSVSRGCIYNWRKEGMPYKKIGKTVRFDLDEVKKWINERSK